MSDIEVKDDAQIVKELLKVVNFHGKLKQHVLLGRVGDTPRPIKLVFHSTSDANSAISNSGKLKSFINQ